MTATAKERVARLLTGTPSGSKVPVSERAIIQRINRALKPESQGLKKGRGRGAGRFYHVDFAHNWVIREDVSLPALATELGVLQAWEEVTDE